MGICMCREKESCIPTQTYLTTEVRRLKDAVEILFQYYSLSRDTDENNLYNEIPEFGLRGSLRSGILSRVPSQRSSKSGGNLSRVSSRRSRKLSGNLSVVFSQKSPMPSVSYELPPLPAPCIRRKRLTSDHPSIQSIFNLPMEPDPDYDLDPDETGVKALASSHPYTEIPDLVTAFQRLLEESIKVLDVLKHLHFLDGTDTIRLKGEQSPTAAVRMLLDVIRQSREPRKWELFVDALQKEGYDHIVKVLKGETREDHAINKKLLKLFRPKIMVRMHPPEFIDRLFEKDVIGTADKEEIEREMDRHGETAASFMILQLVPRKLSNWYNIFKDVLRSCGMEDLVAEIEETESGGYALQVVDRDNTNTDESELEQDINDLQGVSTKLSEVLTTVKEQGSRLKEDRDFFNSVQNKLGEIFQELSNVESSRNADLQSRTMNANRHRHVYVDDGYEHMSVYGMTPGHVVSNPMERSSGNIHWNTNPNHLMQRVQRELSADMDDKLQSLKTQIIDEIRELYSSLTYISADYRPPPRRHQHDDYPWAFTNDSRYHAQQPSRHHDRLPPAESGYDSAFSGQVLY